MTDKVTEDAIKHMFIPGEVCVRKKSTLVSDLIHCLALLVAIVALTAAGLWN